MQVEFEFRGFGWDHSVVPYIDSIKASSTFNDRSLNREYQDPEPIGFYAIKVCDKTGIERIFSIS